MAHCEIVDAKECLLPPLLDFLCIIFSLICGFVSLHVQEKVISIFTVETHLHKALTFYVHYAFVLYSIGAFSIIYISACTRVLTSLKKLGHFNNVGIILVCSVCLHVCKNKSVCKTVCVSEGML